ncbi:hypothetical protein Tco_0849794 [Tanacetum coccineum]
MHIRNDPSFFLTNRTGAPHGDELDQNKKEAQRLYRKKRTSQRCCWDVPRTTNWHQPWLQRCHFPGSCSSTGGIPFLKWPGAPHSKQTMALLQASSYSPWSGGHASCS